MPRILVRAAQDPTRVLDPIESARRMGGNAGNLLYANAVVRALSARPNRVRTGGFLAHTLEDPSDFLTWVNHNFDRYVLPMANSFRFGHRASLRKMAEIVRGLDVPVTVVGVGAQTTVEAAELTSGFKMGKTGSKWVPEDEEGKRQDSVVRDFVEAVLEKSESIGVRGPVTKRYLESIGIASDRVDVIGCPSIFTWGNRLEVKKGRGPVTADSAISMSVDYRVAGIGAVVEKNAEMYPRLTSVVQDARSARMIITGKDQYKMANRDPRTPIHTGHVLYREGRLLFYPSPWGWIAGFRGQQFAFGNRLHGNIAAILGGTPAHLLAHDSRTLELAEYHRIPFSLLDEYAEPPSAAELWERTDFEQFNNQLSSGFDTYLAFLHRNGLETVFDGGAGARRFDRRIRAGVRSRPVVSGVGWARKRRPLTSLRAMSGLLHG